jgi:hypothetical protein
VSKSYALAQMLAKMLNRVLIGVCILICASLAKAQGCADAAFSHQHFKWAGTQPLVLLTEYNPWAMVIGSDSPTFALYANGTVIYWRGEGRSGKYMTVTLAPSAVAELLKSAHLDETHDLGNCYSIADYTDAPTNFLVFRTKAGYKAIDVYGVIRHNENIPPARMPVDLQEAFRVLLGFNAPNAQEWTPPYLEVMMWPFSYAKSSMPWPVEFPGVTDKNTRQSPRGLDLYLPYTEFDQYKVFASKLKPTTAVLLDGKKWAISERIPFPHEGKP